MREISFYEQNSEPIALALGFFDCIHLGHKKLIENCKVDGLKSAVFTFSSDPSIVFNSSKQLYTYEERLSVLNNLDVDFVINCEFTKEFSMLDYSKFLEILENNFNIKRICVGSDYTFGKDAKGNVNILKEYCDKKNIELCIIDFELDANGSKLSTRNLRELVKWGDIKQLNQYLTEPYFIIGNIIHAKHIGTLIGFPTANIMPKSSRFQLNEGVYATKIEIDGKLYNSMTNVGKKPTFNDDSYSIESFIFDFNNDIYNKNTKIIFIEKVRDIQKFDNSKELIKQLKQDEKKIKELLK